MDYMLEIGLHHHVWYYFNFLTPIPSAWASNDELACVSCEAYTWRKRLIGAKVIVHFSFAAVFPIGFSHPRAHDGLDLHLNHKFSERIIVGCSGGLFRDWRQVSISLLELSSVLLQQSPSSAFQKCRQAPLALVDQLFTNLWRYLWASRGLVIEC